MINFKTIAGLALAGSVLFAVNVFADDHHRKRSEHHWWRWMHHKCYERCEDAKWPHACYEHCKREHRREHRWFD